MTFATTPVTMEEVLLDWYRSESERWKDHRLAYEKANPGLNETQLAGDSLRNYRAPLFNRKSTNSGVFFDELPTTWLKADVEVGVLAEAIPMNCWGMPDARSVEALVSGHNELRNIKVTRDQLKHRPILATKSVQARPMLLDGYHRVAGLINANEQRLIPVFYCVCERIDDWHFYWEPYTSPADAR
jgi:hypothetical protein